MNIDELIEKYFNGETTRDEEAIINRFLHEHPNHAKYKELFVMMQGFDNASDIKSTNSLNPFNRKSLSSKWRIAYLSAAAVILIVISTILFNVTSEKKGIIVTEENLIDNKELTQEKIGTAFRIAADEFADAVTSIEKINYNKNEVNPLEKLELINKYSNKRKVKS